MNKCTGNHFSLDMSSGPGVIEGRRMDAAKRSAARYQGVCW